METLEQIKEQPEIDIGTFSSSLSLIHSNPRKLSLDKAKGLWVIGMYAREGGERAYERFSQALDQIDPERELYIESGKGFISGLAKRLRSANLFLSMSGLPGVVEHPKDKIFSRNFGLLFGNFGLGTQLLLQDTYKLTDQNRIEANPVGYVRENTNNSLVISVRSPIGDYSQ